MEEVAAKTDVEKPTKDFEWLNWIKQLTDGIFRKSLAVVVLYYILNFLIDIGIKAFEDEKTDILFMVMTLFIGIVNLLFAFFYATSQGSVDKSKQIDKVLNGEE